MSITALHRPAIVTDSPHAKARPRGVGGLVGHGRGVGFGEQGRGGGEEGGGAWRVWMG